VTFTYMQSTMNKDDNSIRCATKHMINRK